MPSTHWRGPRGSGGPNGAGPGWAHLRPSRQDTRPKALGRETNAYAQDPAHRRCPPYRPDGPSGAGAIAARPPRHSPKLSAMQTNAHARGSLASALWDGGGPDGLYAGRTHCGSLGLPRHWAVRRMPMPARPWHRRVWRWPIGWTQRKLLGFAFVLRIVLKARFGSRRNERS